MAPPPVVIWKVCAASECSTNSISTALNCFREINFGARRLSPSLGQTWASREPLFDYQISTHTTCSCMMRACMRFVGAPKRSNPHTPRAINPSLLLTDWLRGPRAKLLFMCVVWHCQRALHKSPIKISQLKQFLTRKRAMSCFWGDSSFCIIRGCELGDPFPFTAIV